MTNRLTDGQDLHIKSPRRSLKTYLDTKMNKCDITEEL